MPTALFVRGWRLFFYANEGFEPMHIHARKGDAECKLWLLQDQFEIEGAFEHNLTPSFDAKSGRSSSSTSMSFARLGRSASEGLMETETSPVLAKAIDVTDSHLVIATGSGRYEVPWEKCSAKLARATRLERSKAELSPSGY